MLLVCGLMTLVFIFVVGNAYGRLFGPMALLLTLIFVPITVSSYTRRLELSQGKLRLVQLTGSKVCPVSDIAALRLTRFGDGLSRCAVVRRDGTLAFGVARAAWPTGDLVMLAQVMGVPTQAA